MAWKSDTDLKLKLEELVRNSIQNSEILMEVKLTFAIYAWSLRTLKRRLQYFNIKRIDKNLSPSILVDVVKKEIETSGKLLGYRAMHRKIRNEYNLLVTRNDVYLAMNLIAPDQLEERKLVNKRKKFHKRTFTSKGSNFMWSLDGHDKLMGRNKAEFPLAIHGCIDTFSRKLLWLKIWPSNSIPELPATLFLNAILETGYMPHYTRSDRGSENVILATIQNYLHDSENDKPHHLFGTSTSNQVIEQWWRGLRERQGEIFKDLINDLTNNYYYNSNLGTCRVLLAALYIPLIQSNLDSFKENWNLHRIRAQRINRPCGVVRLLYDFPQEFGGEQCGEHPNVDKFDFVSKKVNVIHNFKFVSNDIEREINFALDRYNLKPITLNNINIAYGILINEFQNRELSFVYS